MYFYPEAMTPGCTTQACDFRDSLNQLDGAGYQVVGVSRDEVAKLAAFVKNDHLTFPILSDPDHGIHDQWGTYGEKLMYGKTVIGCDPVDVRARRERRDHPHVLCHEGDGPRRHAQEEARSDRVARQQHERDHGDRNERPADGRVGELTR